LRSRSKPWKQTGITVVEIPELADAATAMNAHILAADADAGSLATAT
jgi:hypothetical protein